MSELFLIALLLISPFQAATDAGVKVSGHVTPAGSPAAPGSGRVLMTGRNVTKPQEVIVGAGGSFEFLNVLPGFYVLLASPGVMSQPSTITVADKDITGIELVNPRTVTVTGNVVVEGGGLQPGFTVSFSSFAGGGISPTAQVQAGAFKTVVPEGDYRVAWSGIPAGYIVRSAVAGSVDLLARPMTLAGADATPITITLGVSSPPPWVKVSGRVTGITNVSPVAPRVTLLGGGTESLETTVRSDGTFEFPMVLRGTYTARITPAPAALPAVSVFVLNKDVADVQIDVPVMKCVPGRVIVEGDGPIPGVTFSFAGASSSSIAVVTPGPGEFGILVPEGERRVSLTSTLPAGYLVKSLTYGSQDLLRNPLKMTSADSSELLLTFAAAPHSWGNVSGRVTGIDPSARKYRVAMTGLIPREVPLQPDGSFEFRNVLRGNHTLSLNSSDGIPVSKTIVVADQDMTAVEIAAPPQKEVVGRVMVEGSRPGFFYFSLTLRGSSGTRYVSPAVASDGTFKVVLAEGESVVSLSGVAANAVKSFTYGDADILKEPLRVSRTDTAELRLTLATGTTTQVLGGIAGAPPPPPGGSSYNPSNTCVPSLPVGR